MAGVHVSVFPINFGRESTAPYGAISDREGRVRFPPIVPGTYFYMGEMPGFISVMKKPSGIPLPSLVVKALQKIEDLRVEMAPQSILAGRVLDEAGDPVMGARIAVEPPNRTDPAMSIPRTSTEKTDGRGEFRWLVGPGKWVVKAESATLMRDGKPEIREGVAVTDYPPVFYPSAVERERAKVIEIGPGQVVEGLEIRLSRQGGVTIRGTVSGMPSDMEFGQVILRCGKDEKSFQNSSYQSFRKDGKFQFSAVAPGMCEVTAGTYPQSSATMTPAFVRRFDADTTLDLVLVPGGELRGQVVWPGGAAVEGAKISLVGKASFAPVPIAKDGSFRFPKVFPGKTRFAITGLAATSYLAAVELDGAKAPDDELNLVGDISRSKVVLRVSDGGSRVGGHLLDAAGERITGTVGGAFLLRSKDEEPAQRNSFEVRAEGTYEFKNLRPGKYWLCGFDVARTGLITASAELMKIVVASAVEIELKEGESAERDLKVPTREAADAKR